MMKRFFSALLAIILLACSLPSTLGAYTVTKYITDTICYTLDTESGTLTFSGTGAMPTCKSNTNNEWSRNASATTIIIEDGITEIGACNFYNNNYVTRVIIGDSVKTIDTSAFFNCKQLVTVDCGGELETISDWAFSGCSALRSFFFPPTLKYLGSQSFFGCSQLRNIELPEEIETIYANAFTSSGYYNSLPSGINTLCGYTLELKGTSANSTTRIPDGTRVISIHTLTSQKSVTSLVLPDSLERILYQGFFNLTSLKEITIPGSVTEMEDFCVGYITDSVYSTPITNESFLIKGRGGTEAERYAEECDFAFECLCSEEDAVYIYYPDCLAGGTAVIGCPYCGKVYSEVPVLPADAHAFGAAQIEPATCTTDGRIYKKCSLCGYEKIEGRINATGHKPGTSPIITPATCTEMGSIAFVCTVCGKICEDQTMYMAATGHVVTDEFTVVKEATCTENGIKQRSCAVCGEIVETEEIPATGHRPSGKWTVLNPSVASDRSISRGFRVKRCRNCGLALEYEYFYVGDLNSDDAVDMKDVRLIKKFLSGDYVGTIDENADFDGDGSLSILDLRMMKHYIS